MDANIIAVSAMFETFALRALADSQRPTAEYLWIFVEAFIVQYALLKFSKMVYKLFIYPFYVSPLRHLPGPKVRQG
jgi:hypothetical protein